MADKQEKKDVFDYLRPFTVKYIKPGVDWLTQNRLHAVMVIVGLILFVLIIKFVAGMVKNVLVISLLILIGGISKIYQRFFKVQLGIEFIMLSTVVSGYVYGPFVGGVVGFVTFGLSTYFSGMFSHTLAVSFILMTLIGIAASFFTGTSIKAAGITLTIIYNLFFIPIYIGLFRGRYSRIFLFSITHLFWNFWVFSAIAPLVVSILK